MKNFSKGVFYVLKELLCINTTIAKNLETGKALTISPGSTVLLIRKLRSKYVFKYMGRKVIIDESTLSNFQ